MISKTVVDPAQPQPKKNIRLVRNRPAPSAPLSPERKPVENEPPGDDIVALKESRAGDSIDPLESPLKSHCSLCGNQIQSSAVTEKRMSGRNFIPQVWFYHEICWKQLERMRRWDYGPWQGRKKVAFDVRYSASSVSSQRMPNELSDCLGSSWKSNVAG